MISTRLLRLVRLSVLTLGLCMVASTAQALSFQVDGMIAEIIDPFGVVSGMAVGQSFSGTFTYDPFATPVSSGADNDRYEWDPMSPGFR